MDHNSESDDDTFTSRDFCAGSEDDLSEDDYSFDSENSVDAKLSKGGLNSVPRGWMSEAGLQQKNTLWLFILDSVHVMEGPKASDVPTHN
jgi:hypothetical protein